MRVGILGAGATGARAARQLLASDSVEEVLLADVDRRRMEQVVTRLGHRARPWLATDPGSLAAAADALVLAQASGSHLEAAHRALESGRHVVSLSDDPDEVGLLLALDGEARERGLHVVVGAGFSPGFSCLLARHASARFDAVDEIHVAKLGTGGPACARQHHRALRGWTVDWRDGRWVRRSAGSGRELLWFPGEVGAADCYRARLAEPLLLVQAMGPVERVTARMAATRRDRLTAPAPMLRRPHPEGRVGAVRVEVRGRRGTARDVLVLGAMERPAVAAGAVAAAAAVWAVQGRLGPSGAGGLASVETAGALLGELHERGIGVSRFEGAPPSAP